MYRDLVLVGLALFTWGIGEGSFFLFQPLYLEELGASPVLIGTILGGVGIAMSLAHVPAGLIADRVGRRQMLWISWCFGVSATWFMALANSLPLFVVGMLLYAVTAFVMSPLNSYVTAARGTLSVGRSITLTSAAYNSGAVLGPIIGGFIGNNFGLHKTYLFAACVFIVSTLVILNIRPQPVQPRDREQGASILKNRAFLGYMGIVFLAILALYLPQPLTPNFLQNHRQVSLSQIGWIGSAGSLGNVLLSLGLGAINANRGFIISQISVAAFSLLIWKGNTLPYYVLGYFLLGGYRVARSLVIANVRELVELANMGLAYGITETVSALSIIFVAPLAGWIYERTPNAVFQISIGLIVVTILISAFFTPRQKHPEMI